MLWFPIIVGVVAICAIGACRHVTQNGSVGPGWSGYSSDDEDMFDDDMLYSPVYDHLPCNVWHNSFESSGMDWSSLDDGSISSTFDDWSSTSMFDDDSFGCSSFDDGCGCGSSWDD